ncbi:hypothetical protein [Streptococcus gallolyticus]|uniref:hypothetical protein n=1 Tax=Streptococcus gallolyticus TaxID=315405 RepID=UPI0022852213|nr:hypothetical protein [Streptococcus gallolyticus]MCY7187271.1 hypothetical protein [Streptococcus gallolyticus subsp. gallolyticus]
MFIKLIANVNGTTVEKTFDSVKSLKENYLSMTMAHKIETIILMNGSVQEQYNRALAVLVGHEEEDKLIGLAYLCETFSSLEELYNSLGDTSGLHCEEYVRNNDENLENMLSGKSVADIIKTALMGDYRWSDDFVRLDGYANLESTNYLPYEVDFSDMYDRYFEENDIDDVEWSAMVRVTKDGEFLEAKQFEVYALFYNDAYELAKEEALEYIENEIDEDVDFTIEMELKGK